MKNKLYYVEIRVPNGSIITEKFIFLKSAKAYCRRAWNNEVKYIGSNGHPEVYYSKKRRDIKLYEIARSKLAW